MNIKPMAAPSAPTQGPQADRRAAAIAAFNTAGQAPVQNPTQVSPEELSAIHQPQMDTSTPAEETEAPKLEEKQPDPALSRRFAQLARQEKALRAQAQQQAQDLKAKEEALAAREAALASKDSEYSQKYVSKDRFKADPLAALTEAGFTYEELTERIMNQQPADPRVEAAMARSEARIAQLEAKLEEAQKNQVSEQQAQYNQAINQIKAEANKLVFTDPNFETVKATNSVKDVVELIERTYKEDNTLLSVEEAAQMVEDYLIDEAMKVTKISKIQKRLQEQASQALAAKAAQTPASDPKQPQPMKTLTNAASSSRKLTAVERAKLAFRGELKS